MESNLSASPTHRDETDNSSEAGNVVNQTNESLAQQAMNTVSSMFHKIPRPYIPIKVELGEETKEAATKIEQTIDKAVKVFEHFQSQVKMFLLGHNIENDTIDRILSIMWWVINVYYTHSHALRISIITQRLHELGVFSISKISKICHALINFVRKIYEGPLKIDDDIIIPQGSEDFFEEGVVLFETFIDVCRKYWKHDDIEPQFGPLPSKSILDWCKGISAVKGAIQGIAYLGSLGWEVIKWMYFCIHHEPLVTDETKVTAQAAVNWMKDVEQIQLEIRKLTPLPSSIAA
jgi:hypothetical protein